MKIARYGVPFIAILLVGAPAGQAPGYDLVLRGGTIVDGTGAARFRGDIAIRGGRIAAVGDLGSGRGATELDVRGLMVAPGFINVHSHASPAALATAVNMLTQGVTTELLNADGGGPLDLDQQLGAIETSGLALNVAASTGFNAVWQSVVGLSDRRPTAAEIEKMGGIIVANLERGAFGVSAGLDYKPAYFAKAEEVIAILKPAGRWRTFFPNHDRSTPESGYSSKAGVEETRDIAEKAGLVPEFTHMKIQGHEQGTARRVIEMMERRSGDGRWIAADVYPYLAGQTGLASLIIPGWAQAGGVDSMRSRFRDPAQRGRIVAEADAAIKARFNGPERIMVTGTRRLSDIMKEVSAATAGEAVVKVLETETPWAILGFGIEEDLVELMRYRSSAIACDCGATPSSRGHPRYYGTYPRVLGRYVRETKALTWEDAIRKMSGLPAALMGLVDRGLLAPGMAADVVVFDSATVIDHATFEKPDAPSEGIRHVLVNGKIALRDGAATGERGGVVLRRTGNMPSRPMDLAPSRRVDATGRLTGLDDRTGYRVTIALRQGSGARTATGTIRIEAAGGGAPIEAVALGNLQTAASWASLTGRVRTGPTDERAFTLIVEGRDPFVEGGPATVRIAIEGRPPLAGRLDRPPTIETSR